MRGDEEGVGGTASSLAERRFDGTGKIEEEDARDKDEEGQKEADAENGVKGIEEGGGERSVERSEHGRKKPSPKEVAIPVVGGGRSKGGSRGGAINGGGGGRGF